MPAYTFQRAGQDDLADIHRLNHRIFVDEVGQHQPTGNGLLVDRFDKKNAYFVARRRSRLVGMVALNGEPPFSAAAKVSDPSVLEALGGRVLEVRLLAVEPAERNRRTLAGLLYSVLQHSVENGFSHLLISGVREQLGMYARLGFAAIGPPVKCGDAEFTPMALRVADIPPVTLNRFVRWGGKAATVSLLPGPVQASLGVQLAFSHKPVSHRNAEFVRQFDEVRIRIGELSGGLRAGLFPGSGTLANDVAAAAIAADPSRRAGLILSNGEFGSRLTKHAERWRLTHSAMNFTWGTRWDIEAVAAYLDAHPHINWIWGVHLETSTGMVNDTAALVAMAQARGVAVYLDCVSSFGAMRMDLRGVTLATTVSGKSIGGYAGVAVVIADGELVTRLRSEYFPPSLDLPAALSGGPAMTFPSPVIKALRAALAEQGPAKWAHYASLGELVRKELRLIGLQPLVEGPDAAPVITTFRTATAAARAEMIRRCSLAGFALAADSDYLKEREWLQIATMGDVRAEDITRLFDVCRPQQSFSRAATC